MSSLRRSSRTNINTSTSTTTNTRPVNRRIELEDQLRKLRRNIKGLELSIAPAQSELYNIQNILDSTNSQSLYSSEQLTDLRRLYRKSERKEARLNNKLRPLKTQLFRLEPELMRVIREENTRNGATHAGKRRKHNTRKKGKHN